MQQKKRAGIAGVVTGLLFFLTASAAGYAWWAETSTINTVSTASVRGVIEEAYEQDQECAPGAEVDKEVTVKNTGNVDSIIRVALSTAWGSQRDENGGLIPNDLPTDNIILNYNTDDWVKIGDWYYYTAVLEPEASTAPLIRSFTIDPATGNEYKNMYADIRVKMECIQAEGEAAADVWGVSHADLGIDYQPEAQGDLVTTADFIDPETGFVFRQNQGDLFANFKKLVPGESRSQTVTVSNKWSGVTDIWLYARLAEQESADAGELEKIDTLLKELVMITLTDHEGTVLYEGNVQGALDADGTAPETMKEEIWLGTFGTGTEKDIHIALSVDKDMENEYADLLGKVTWHFVARGEEEEPPVDNDPEDPVKEVLTTTRGGGDGSEVYPGEQIRYQISYYNHHAEAATVTVTDYLDPKVMPVGDGGDWEYIPEEHKVVWVIENVPGGERGSVTLTVQVNNDAAGGSVENTGGVIIGNEDEVHTDTTENPVIVPEPEEPRDPVKTIDGTSESGLNAAMVKAGDQITYRIAYYNHTGEAATVTITDKLDEGLAYVGSVPAGDYDEDTHTVTWTIADAESHEWGYVLVTTEVTETASEMVVNTADVSINGETPRSSEEVENRIEPNAEPQAPEKILDKTTSPDAIARPGDQLTYQISYYKHHAAAADITVTDYLDADVTLLYASHDGSYVSDGHKVVWTIPDVPGRTGGAVTLTVLVNDVIEGDVIENTGGVIIGNEEEVQTNIITTEAENPEPDAARNPRKTVDGTSGSGLGSADVKAGDQLTYRIAYYNHTDEAADVIITDKLDSGVEYKGSEPEGDYDEDTHTVTWTITGAESHEWGYVLLTVTVADKAEGTIMNQAEVTLNGDSADTNEVEHKVEPEKPTDPQAPQPPQDDDPEDPEKELTYTTSTDGIVRPGDQLTYEISYYNHHAEAADVIITDYLDQNVTLLYASNDGTYMEEGHRVVWEIKQVDAKTSGRVSLTVLVNDVIEGDVIENTGGVIIGNEEEVQTNIITTEAENPEPDAAQNPRKTVDGTSGSGLGSADVKAGDQLTYRIAYYNHTDEAATVTITDKLDENLKYVGSEPEGDYDEDTHTVTWTITGAESHEWDYVLLTVTVADEAEGTIINQAEVTLSGDSADTNEVEHKVEPEKPTDPSIPQPPQDDDPEDPEKELTYSTSTDGIVRPGDQLTYEISYYNHHAETAEVIITDKLDPGLEYISSSPEGTYSKRTHTVTWTLAEAAAKTYGRVRVTVAVTDDVAAQADNQAQVKIGEDTEVTTNTVSVPTGNPDETQARSPLKVISSDSRSGQNNETVSSGDQITYEIRYYNHFGEPAEVIITDKLDAGLKFIAADQRGTYDSQTHTVTWTIADAAPGEWGSVTLIAEVTDYAGSSVINKAEVQTGEDEAIMATNTVTSKLSSAAGGTGNDGNGTAGDSGNGSSGSNQNRGSSGFTTTSAPKTGDMRRTWALTAAAVISLILFTATSRRRQKKVGNR